MLKSFLWYSGKIIGRINWLCRHLEGWRLAQYDFFKDPIYFRITPLSVYITNNIIPLSVYRYITNLSCRWSYQYINWEEISMVFNSKMNISWIHFVYIVLFGAVWCARSCVRSHGKGWENKLQSLSHMKGAYYKY